MSYVIGAFISTNVIWYVIFFSTLDVKTKAAEIAQYFATWIWQVGLIFFIVRIIFWRTFLPIIS